MTRRTIPWLVLIGILVAALSLRAPIIALTPVLPEIISDLGISSASAGLLTTAPVVMFAVVTPLAALVIRRAGAEIALLLSLAGVMIGTLVRALPGFGSMLAGMVVIGAAITIGNVVIPVIIRRDLPPERTAIATAAYTATLNAGSLFAALATVPIAEATGWPLALLLWGSFGVIGISLWLVHIVRSRAWSSADRTSGEAATSRSGATAETATLTGPTPVIVDNRVAAIIRRPIVWLLAAAFATQSTVYYAMSTWFPTILLDTTDVDAVGAGALSSVFQGVAIVGAMIAPLLLRFVGAVYSALLLGVFYAVMVIGMLIAPEFAGLWASFGAITHSGGFVLIFTALVRVSRSDAEAATTSAVVQGGGYLFAALGAPVMGALREASGGWQVPLLAITVVVLAYTIALMSAMVVAFRRR
ncbi:MFS transporter [Microbacterium aerolatum]|uniref:Cyanate transporter n=1 Tax=Microbacterium aerolatum TaxID=153731 RepID=A0A511AFC3_9MICO|nr:MFS transporter [Microbacterium aerolatum]GEK86855.1 cyanate transporter [Microbacterium aerolatum]GGB24567.1 cyanate transporter [Microbacterium aerolatum]